jgi:hypothetical protein
MGSSGARTYRRCTPCASGARVRRRGTAPVTSMFAFQAMPLPLLMRDFLKGV